MNNKKKKILLLGGSYAQIPAIKAANDRGLYTILCDYLPDNPGQKFADEYINASTTDKEHILEIARERGVDYVWAYASDPAAPTSAYVSEIMGLPGNTYNSVRTLSEKHLFRQLLRDAGLPCPRSLTFTKEEVNSVKELSLSYPLIVKPVDSSGSKGVILIESFSDFSKAVKYALTFSRSGRIIAEEYINTPDTQLHGDGFILNGELVFCYLGDHHYNKNINQFVPYSTSWPAVRSETKFGVIYEDISTLIKHSGFKNGPVNIEIRITEDNEIYIMEIGPRSGGNFVPQLLTYASGFDMVEASLNVALGDSITIPKIKKEFAAYYVIHSSKNGVLKKISVSPVISKYIKEQHQYAQVGDQVSSFQGSNAALGILLMLFPSRTIMHDIMVNIEQYVTVEIE